MIASFRPENFAAVAESFLQVLLLASQSARSEILSAARAASKMRFFQEGYRNRRGPPSPPDGWFVFFPEQGHLPAARSSDGNNAGARTF